MDLKTISAAIAAHKKSSEMPQHTWPITFTNSATNGQPTDGVAGVRIDVKDGTAFVMCIVNSKTTMVFKAEQFVSTLVSIITSYRSPPPIEDVSKGLFAKAALNTERVWFNTTSRGNKVNSFAVPLDEIETVIKLITAK